MGTLVGSKIEQLYTVELYGTAGHDIPGTTHHDRSKCRLTSTVGPHDRMDFAASDGEVKATQDLFLADPGGKVFDD